MERSSLQVRETQLRNREFYRLRLGLFGRNCAVRISTRMWPEHLEMDMYFEQTKRRTAFTHSGKVRTE